MDAQGFTQKITKNINLKQVHATYINPHGHTEPHKSNLETSWYTLRLSWRIEKQLAQKPGLAAFDHESTLPMQSTSAKHAAMTCHDQDQRERKKGTHKRMISSDEFVMQLIYVGFIISLTDLKPAITTWFFRRNKTTNCWQCHCVIILKMQGHACCRPQKN